MNNLLMSLDVPNASGVNRLGMSFQNSIFAASFPLKEKPIIIKIPCPKNFYFR
ncbi:hypothetical protein [Flavobacterium daejeonense]|uniref:hypothetical protein n=1 Tax=Flavobacterium daejeonense TaxID=350893 RepID=UPI0012DE7618|nr:hypothetical protein [Flavobacterium daejeonense]